MALNSIRGPGLNLQQGTYFSLGAGETLLVAPGTWQGVCGPYTFLEWFDPIVQIWRPVSGLGGVAGVNQIESDGSNFRFANRTGTMIGAKVTNVGSAYTSAPVVAASAGGSTWRAVVGGAINSTITITAGGTLYTQSPILVIPPPPAGGVPATAIATISGGAINAVTVINQGAGYAVAPPVFIINDPRDTTGSGGVLTTALTGSGTITAVLNVTQGTPLSAVPTLTFTGGGGSSAAASALMVASSTGVVFSGATNAGNGNFAIIPAIGATPANSAVVNPSVDLGLFLPRMGYTQSTTTASPTTATIVDGGLGMYTNSGTITPVIIMNSNGTISGATTLGTNTFGGVTDTCWIQPS